LWYLHLQGLAVQAIILWLLDPEETSRTTRWNSRHYVPEDLNLQKHHCDNLKYHFLNISKARKNNCNNSL
jgi:hypothetical protein